MFVKIVPPYESGASSQLLFEVPEVRFGTVVSHASFGKRDFDSEVGVGFKLLRTPGLIDVPNGQDEVGDYWLYRYAVWPDEFGENIGLMTSGDIYILNDDGKTIDRAVS
jgi:hypothetical protein